MCVCGAKSTVTLGFFIIKMLYSEVYKKSFFFIIRALDYFAKKALWVGGLFKPTLAK